MTADEIASEFPGLTLADVHAALSYYYDNIDSIREEIHAESEAADRSEASSESILKAKLSQAKRVS